MISAAEMLDEHLPYRMQHVDGLSWACQVISSVPDSPAHVLMLPQAAVVLPSYRILTNALSECGLLYCRVLMNFLGLSTDKRSGELREVEKPGGGDDFSIIKLSLPQVTVAQVLAAPTGTAVEVREACERTLFAANKGVAHFTDQTTTRSFITDAHRCAETVLWLIERHVYQQLHRAIPVYRTWTGGPTTP